MISLNQQEKKIVTTSNKARMAQTRTITAASNSKNPRPTRSQALISTIPLSWNAIEKLRRQRRSLCVSIGARQSVIVALIFCLTYFHPLLSNVVDKFTRR